jgi:hypothetical protein
MLEMLDLPSSAQSAGQKRKMDCVLIPPLPYKLRSMRAEAAVDTDHKEPSLEDVLNEAWARNERAGTIPVAMGEWSMPGRTRDAAKLTRTPTQRRELTHRNNQGESAAPPTASSIGLIPASQPYTVLPKNGTENSVFQTANPTLSADKFFRYTGAPWPKGAGAAMYCHQCRGRSGGMCMTFTEYCNSSDHGSSG